MMTPTRYLETAIALFALLTANLAAAGSMLTEAESAYLTPPVARTSASVQNGDFFITGSTRGRGTGDGRDEATLWAFNFRKDRAQYQLFRRANPRALDSAVVELRIQTDSQGQSNDALWIGSLPPIPVESLTDHGVHTIRIDLLEYFDGETLLEELRASSDAVLFIRYQDDAIVHHAELRVTYAD